MFIWIQRWIYLGFSISSCCALKHQSLPISAFCIALGLYLGICGRTQVDGDKWCFPENHQTPSYLRDRLVRPNRDPNHPLDGAKINREECHMTRLCLRLCTLDRISAQQYLAPSEKSSAV
jgi:hypothetical protein